MPLAALVLAAALSVVRIGFDAPLSGADGAVALPARDAVLLGIDDANARLARYNLRLADSTLDDAVQGKHDPAQGAQNFKSFIADPAVLAVIGPFNSNVAKVTLPLANAAQLPQIAIGTTAVELTRGAHAQPATFFRLCATDDRQGAAAAHYALRSGVRRVAVVDDGETYGTGLANVFTASFTAGGGTVTTREHLTPMQQDFHALLTKAAGAKPQALYFGGLVSTGAGMLRRQMADGPLATAAFYGGDGIADPEFPRIAGPGAEGTLFTVPGADPRSTAQGRGFLERYARRFGRNPGAYGPQAYAAVTVIAAALETLARSGAQPSRPALARALAATRVTTVLGPVAFDAHGDDRFAALSVYRFENAVPHFVGVER